MTRLRLLPFLIKAALAAVFGIGSAILIGGATLLRSTGQQQAPIPVPPALLTIDYPLNGSVFPPEITSPTFLWHDPSETAQRWVVEVSFRDRSSDMRSEAAGEHQQMGEIDLAAGQPEPMTPEQASTRTWKPDSATWAKIKQESVNSAATITISGFADGNSTSPVSQGAVTISTSRDPAGAPIFYRDVPLMTAGRVENGSITPLPVSALPLIKWRVRDISQPQSRGVRENRRTCAR